MEYSTTIPIWLQVLTHIKGEIVTGKLPPGEKLPGGRDLAVRYAINPNTAARVYKELELAGLCVTKRGLGTFVTEDAGRIVRLRKEMANQAMVEFLERLSSLGLTKNDAICMLTKEESNNA